MHLYFNIFFGLVGTYVAIRLLVKWLSLKKQDYELLTKYYVEKNWSYGRADDVDRSIYPFQIKVPKQQIENLKARLKSTRYPVPSLKDSKFHYGMRDDYMKDLVNYWINDYSWKKQEDWMNSYNHFKTTLEGLSVHFIHEKPDIVATGVVPKVILLIHGWPGSFVELLEMIPMLTHPTAHGGNESDVFEVVCPSIPGYGFSDSPQKQGFNMYECARIFHQLMHRCGYNEYYVHGGDWGSAISTAMAQLYPSSVKGIHTTLGSNGPRGLSWLKTILGAYAPSLFFHAREVGMLFPLKVYFKRVLMETGYLHEQATKPDTVGFALSDSPVGLAAYIIEKFSTWTDYASLDSGNGLLGEYWTKDQLLNNVMIYWWNNNITPSMRFYKENFGGSVMQTMQSMTIKVPAGFAWFPNEFFCTTRSWQESRFTNLLHFTYMNRGGHFAAYEVPADLAADLRLFVRRTEKYKRLIKAAEYAEISVKASQLDRFQQD